MRKDELEMKFDNNTIQHLGIQMYSTLPPVLAEVISNAYDADASEVKVYLNDIGEKSIRIIDNGEGMSFNDINEKFLYIGRNRRESDGIEKTKKGRLIIGKKGLGKLSFFGIAKEIKITTINSNIQNSFIMDWQKLKESKGLYKPEIVEHNIQTKKNSGTIIILNHINRKSIFSPQDIASAFSKTFSIFDKNFKVSIIHNNDEKKIIQVSNKLKYEDLDISFSWKNPFNNYLENVEYEYKNKITGQILSSSKTVPNSMRGIALFSRGKLVNEHEFYNVKATSHGYSYISGWLDVSFIEEWNKDVISTNRKSLNWEDEDTEKLKIFITQLIYSFYNASIEKKIEIKKKIINDKTGVDIENWINELPKHEKKLANNIIDKIIKSEGIEDDKAGELVLYVKDSFQFESFKEFASELEKLTNIETDQMIQMFKDWEIIEAREFYKLSQGRIETINKFEIFVKENAKEVPTLHNFIKKFSWLLDPRIIEFKDEVHYSDLLKKKYPDSSIELETDRRIDFLCTTLANNFFIIELKRPNAIVTKKYLDQAVDYRTFIESQIGNDPYSPKQVTAYLICGGKSDDRIVKNQQDTWAKDGQIFVKTYSELLSNAKKYHMEFMKKYEDMEKLKKNN